MNTRPRRYFLYAIVVLAAGLGAWLALEAVLERREVPAEQRAEIEAQVTANMEAMQDRLAESVGGRTTSDAQQRMDSPRGQALMRMCMEWTEFAENHPDADNERARDDACGKLRQYVEESVAE